MKNIIIFMQNRNFFGAQIVHIPLIKQLKEDYPQSKIILFSKNKITNLLLNLGLVQEVYIEKSKLSSLSYYLSCKADITISLRKKSFFINLYISCLNHEEKIGFSTYLSKLFFTKTKDYNSTIYRANNYLNLIDKKLEHKQHQSIKQISIIPGAGGDWKMWNINNYIKLSQALRILYPNYTINFILGKKESEFKEKIPNEFTISYDLEINKLFKTIKQSKLVIANDCGPSHIALISNIPTIILYSDELGDASLVKKEWFNNNNSNIAIIGLAHKPIDSIAVDDVLKYIQLDK
ncbi:MAG: Unknown protein [uncultured Sulfurovum sp.]|uniref:ADP-heptose--lipooligosaccharide heptosyltransferase II (EC) n=1 Tax=uncultured Sulfurovum sp. TaxID=269237 RepID=A0A6S6TIQ0_9BACT|nr:MAG: Unknown protein [uncultured Sulfurovum sp.]